ncbi:GNAT family N-acetyltransferase [Candidatus Thiothrix sp. Deng01]|uniref:GNAT family N-acetyltransferase n=1 Tax=Candidatus Thiothrix phosphatis TaxID=3112415 RepID=A0ABU6CTN3_9GAMM|nr:GNAT family N-acetyltransferase [Candidatus Thiothrix sp. Deng01]MEB4589458.1 GNAT family N-acetyltransferase [Candidatus Thiothrix sp. Deng01]
MQLIEPGQIPADDDSLAAKFVLHAADKINNVVTRMALLDIGAHHFPVSINDGGERPDNSYVVSPLTAYTGYADYELAHLNRPWLAWPLQKLAAGVGRHLQGQHIDRIVQVNNWLLSTNLYPPEWQGAELEAITRLLRERFPDHAFGFRSLNRFSNPLLLEKLAALGYVSVPSRQVYLFDGRAGRQAPFLQRHNTRIDATLLRRTDYALVPGCELADSDYLRLEHLYNLLYLEKYCPLNPQFSADWLRLGQRDGWLELLALRTPQGRIDGVLGWFGNGSILTAPVVGYDTALPQKTGLYRLITRLCLQAAVGRKCLLNFSSGAAHFKRLRGGQPEIEYSMVYVAHLPPARQRVWRMLGGLLHGIGVPLMQRLKL